MIARSLSELNAQHLAVPPNNFAAFCLAPVEKGQLKTIPDARGRHSDDFRAIPGYVHDLALGARKASHRDPGRDVAASLSLEMFR